LRDKSGGVFIFDDSVIVCWIFTPPQRGELKMLEYTVALLQESARESLTAVADYDNPPEIQLEVPDFEED
jgi:hypothetical protein